MSSTPAWPTTVCACTAIRRADRALSRLYDEALRPSGLVTTQYSLLSIIDRAPKPLTLGDLAGAQVMDRTTLTHNLAPLRREGLVQVTNGVDRRTKVIDLTDAGKALLESARPLWRHAQDQVIAVTGTDAHQHLLDDLAALVGQVRQIAVEGEATR